MDRKEFDLLLDQVSAQLDRISEQLNRDEPELSNFRDDDQRSNQHSVFISGEMAKKLSQ